MTTHPEWPDDEDDKPPSRFEPVDFFVFILCAAVLFYLAGHILVALS